MSYLEYTVKTVPTGLRKILFFNWPLAILITAIAALGKPTDQKVHLGLPTHAVGWHDADLVLAQRLQSGLSWRFGLAIVC